MCESPVLQRVWRTGTYGIPSLDGWFETFLKRFHLSYYVVSILSILICVCVCMYIYKYIHFHSRLKGIKISQCIKETETKVVRVSSQKTSRAVDKVASEIDAIDHDRCPSRLHCGTKEREPKGAQTNTRIPS